MNIICLITWQPKKIWCDFLNTFSLYKICMMVDDDAFDLMPFTALYKNIHFIKVNKDLCQQAGYMNTNYFIGKKHALNGCRKEPRQDQRDCYFKINNRLCYRIKE